MSTMDRSAIGQSSVHVGTKPPRKLELAVPAGGRKSTLFSSAILDAGEGDRAKRAAQTALAIAVQAAIVVALIVLPLFFVKGLDIYQLNRTLLVAPLPPAAPSPPVVRAQASVARPVIHAELSVPTVIPKKIATNSLPDAGAPAVAEMSGGVAGGMGDVLGGSLTGAPPPPPVAAAEKSKGPIRITGSMQAPKLIYSPPPVYPQLAMNAHISGSVYIEAVIDERGNVTQVHVISGPPLLVSAALKAVSLRKYAPTILDGEAVAIVLKVEVAFQLS